jgi:hypothetical protein
MDLSKLVPIPAHLRLRGGATHCLPCAMPPPAATPTPRHDVAGEGKKQTEANATEREAARVLRLPEAMLFEGRTFDVLGGTHSYTPDWWVEADRTAVEVKSEHIHSRDSRILFDAARAEYPSVTWIWARKRTRGRKGPRWEIEVYPAR